MKAIELTALCVAIVSIHASIMGDETMPFHSIQENEFSKMKIVNVVNYGAIGNGATECHSAFTNALEAISGGGMLFAPSGTYIIEDSLLINGSNIEICGAGISTTLLFTNPGDGFYTDGSKALRHITIKDLRIQTNNTNAGAAIYFNQTQSKSLRESLISNVEIAKTGDGAWDYGLRAVFAHSCSAHHLVMYQLGSGSVGVFLGIDAANGTASNAWHFSDLQIHSTGLYGVWVKSCSAVSFSGGVIEGGMHAGILVENEGAQTNYTQLSVNGMHFEVQPGIALDLDSGLTGALIAGCYINSTGDDPTILIGQTESPREPGQVVIVGNQILRDVLLDTKSNHCLIMNNLIYDGTLTDNGEDNVIWNNYGAANSIGMDFTLARDMDITSNSHDISVNAGDIYLIKNDVDGSTHLEVKNGIWQDIYRSDEDLVLYLPLSEGTGSVAYDRSIYGHDGTIANGTWTDGKYGNALRFDGDDYITIGDAPDLRFGTGNFTISYWRYRPTGAPGGSMVLSKSNYYGTGNWGIRQYGDDRWNGSDTIKTKILSADTWHHIAFVRDGDAVFVYSDGDLDFHDATFFSGIDYNVTTDLYAGCVEGPDKYLTSTLAEIRLYRRALSPSEIRTHALHGESRQSAVLTDRFRIIGTDGTVDLSVTDGRASAQVISGGLKELSFANPLAVDMDEGNVFTLITTGDCTVNASGGQAGQRATFIITDDATGAHVITFGANFKANGTLTGTANETATVDFVHDGSSWCEVSRTTGL